MALRTTTISAIT